MAADERLAWFPFYTGDMMSTTRGWPLLARGAFYELLAAQWDMGVLPAEARDLRRLLSCTAAEWAILWPYIGSRFPLVAGGRQNEPLERHRVAAARRRTAFQAGAAATNARRWREALGESPSDTPSDPPSDSPSGSRPAPAPTSRRLLGEKVRRSW